MSQAAFKIVFLFAYFFSSLSNTEAFSNLALRDGFRLSSSTAQKATSSRPTLLRNGYQHHPFRNVFLKPRTPLHSTAGDSSLGKTNANDSSAVKHESNQQEQKPEDPGKQKIIFGLSLRRCVMILLIIQNACQMVSMRYSRVVTTSASGQAYLPSTAVVASECLKLLVCVCIITADQKGNTLSFLRNKILVEWKDTLKVTVPALVYTVQNNLLYVAASNLDAATCQITYQLKILTTAMFAITLLGRRISPGKWAALMMLVLGIVCVQLPQITSAAATAATVGNPVVGLAAVVGACFMSGFAGVWFEKILKGSNTSIWVRNVQLGLLGLPLALTAAIAKDGATIASSGFFVGYSPFVWAVVCQVGLGGLIVALVIRYADNILKGFATSLSIIASGLISYFLIPALAFAPSPIWFVGTSLVIAATYLYSIPDPPDHKQFEDGKQ